MPTYKVYKRGNYLEVIDTDNNDLWNVRVDHAFIERKKDDLVKYDFFDYSYSRDEKFLGDIQLSWMVDENDAAWELVDFEEFRTCQIGYVPIDYSCGSAAGGGGGDDGFVVLSGSGNFTVPAGVFNIEVEMWGGGGSPQKFTPVSPGSSKAICGGGAGSYIRFKKIVTPGDVLAYVVGGATLNLGNNGNNTTFASRTASGGLAATIVEGTPNVITAGKKGISTIVSGDELIESCDAEVIVCGSSLAVALGSDSPKGGMSAKFSAGTADFTTGTPTASLVGAGGSIKSTALGSQSFLPGAAGRIVIKYNF
jgi:hypothetical protein